MLNQQHFVYRHIRPDTGGVFYVGKGKMKKNHPERAFSKDRKNPHWQRIVSKCGGFEVEIMLLCESDEIAQLKEKEFISLYGRSDLGRGPLCNLTDGGEGHCGIIVPAKERARRSQWMKDHPISPEARIKLSASRKNGGNSGVVNLGDKLPQWWRDRISAAVRGPNNSQFGKITKVARKVISKDGAIFPSVSAAALSIGIPMKSLYNQLSRHRPNWCGMEFYNG